MELKPLLTFVEANQPIIIHLSIILVVLTTMAVVGLAFYVILQILKR